MHFGIDQLTGSSRSRLRRRLRESRVGALTHAAAVDRRGRSLLETLEDLGASPSLVLTPEHGLDGVAQAEEAVGSPNHGEDGPRVVSLYGKTRESLTPTATDLEPIEILVIDLVDVGSRYYTYAWTALLTVRAAAQAGVHCVVLDRPNPISGDQTQAEGVPQEPDYLSFVGLEPLPIRHCLTIGELLAHFAERDGLALGPDGALSVLPCAGWERHRTAHAWRRPFSPPSPNMPTCETALVYPGGCLLEGTNLSEGRGTTLPFQLVGAPFLDAEQLAREFAEFGIAGAQIRPAHFRPSFEKHANTVCNGVFLQVTEPSLFRPVAAYLALISLAQRQAPNDFEFLTRAYEFETEKLAFDLLTGSDKTRDAIVSGATLHEIVELVAPPPATWADEVRAAEARLSVANA
jgi:uncharacterized protein YbbC (DUF1343 family)